MAGAVSLFLVYIIVLPLIRGEKSWLEEKPAAIKGVRSHRLKHIAAALGRDESDAAIVGRAMLTLGDLLFGQTVDPVRHQVDIPVLVVR